MKKFISFALTCFMLLSFSCCTIKTPETEVDETPSTEITTETSESSVATTKPAPLNPDGLTITISDVARYIFSDVGEDYSAIKFASNKDSDENKKIGVLNYLVIGNKHFHLEKKIGDFDSITVRIYVVEFDMSSDLYNSLSVGNDFMFFEDYGKTKLYVTAINHQYVLSIEACLGINGGFDEENCQRSAPFTIGKAQEAYDAFTSITTDGSMGKTIDEVADKENNLTYRQLATLGLLKGAIQGNATNYKTILEATGEIEVNSTTPDVVIKVVDNTDLEKAMYEKEN